MAGKRAVKAQVSDPHAIPETICDGPLNVTCGGGRAVMTFTHGRAKPGPLFAQEKIEPEIIVRARINLSMANLVALRNLLNRLIRADKPPRQGTAAAGGGTSIH